MQSKKRKDVFIAMAAVASGVAIGGTMGAVSGSATAEPAGAVETNERGQTYGSPLWQEASVEVPDLLIVEATNGKTGYINLEQEFGPLPVTPEEAVEFEKNRPTGPQVIPVYESDGVTVIGEFQVDPGSLEK